MRVFYKVTGGGNDFLAFPESSSESNPAASSPINEEEIRAFCTRGHSVGADGLFMLRPTASGVQMDYFNADGRPAALCLNGARCAAHLAHELGWCAGELEILTGAGTIGAAIGEDGQVRLEVPVPGGAPAAVEISIDDRTVSGYRLRIGVPYLVVEWSESLESAPVATLGRRLRHAPEAGPTGANVDFVRFVSPSLIEMRVYERGVEAETLASGTGALAAAAVGAFLAKASPPLEVLTKGGSRLTVEGEIADGRFTRWLLGGDARVVARGELWPGAKALPPPPQWTP